MAVPTLLLSPEESRDRSGPVVPTLADSVEVVNDVWRVLVETENRFVDPYSTGTSNHGYGPLACTRTVVLENGVRAMRFTRTGTGYWGPYFGVNSRPDIAAGETWTVSGEVRSPDNSVPEVGVSFNGTYHLLEIASNWRRFEITQTFDINRPAFTTAIYDIRNLLPVTPLVFDVRHLQLEQQPFATPLTPKLIDDDGIPAPGYAWASAPHNSQSIREQGVITTPYAGLIGSVVVRYREDGVVTTDQVILANGTAHFGSYGRIAYENDALTITSVRDTEVLGVVVFQSTLPALEANRVVALDEWTWANLMPKIGGMIRTRPPEPLALSRTVPPEPLRMARMVPPEPLAMTRTVPPEPLAMTRVGEEM